MEIPRQWVKIPNQTFQILPALHPFYPSIPNFSQKSYLHLTYFTQQHAITPVPIGSCLGGVWDLDVYNYTLAIKKKLFLMDPWLQTSSTTSYKKVQTI